MIRTGEVKTARYRIIFGPAQNPLGIRYISIGRTWEEPSTCDKHVREDLLFSLSLLPLHLPRSGGGACDDFQVGSRGAFLSPPPFLLAEGGPHPRPRSLAMALSKAEFGGRSSVRVVVAGDLNTGKSSLIVSAATESFPENVPAVVPPTRLPADYYPDRVPVTIIDTSSRLLSSANSPVSVFFMVFWVNLPLVYLTFWGILFLCVSVPVSERSIDRVWSQSVKRPMPLS